MHEARERMRLAPDEIRELTDLFYGKANHPPFLAAVEQVAARVAAGAIDDDRENDDRIVAWYRVAGHPFMKSAYETDGTLIDAVIELLDQAVATKDAMGEFFIAEDADREPCVWRRNEKRPHRPLTVLQRHRAEPIFWDALERILPVQQKPAEPTAPRSRVMDEGVEWVLLDVVNQEWKWFRTDRHPLDRDAWRCWDMFRDPQVIAEGVATDGE